MTSYTADFKSGIQPWKQRSPRFAPVSRGHWYDFWSRERLEGGREISRKADLETIRYTWAPEPWFRWAPVKQCTAEKVEAPVELWVHPGADGRFSLYEDDGESFDYRKGEFMRIDFAWNDRQRRLTARLASGCKKLGPAKRSFIVHVAGESATRDLVFQGHPVDVKLWSYQYKLIRNRFASNSDLQKA
jgi:alpha-glucosidase (family GH31 glycosyl hydrolase)